MTPTLTGFPSIASIATPSESDQAEPQHANRCFRCFRPHKLCYCDAIPSIANRTDVLILQHRRERSHPFNTARIVHQSLNRCELMVAHNVDLAERFAQTPLVDGAGLLYPGDDAPLLTELSPDQRPKQLVIVDGTWHQAKTLLRDIPRLRSLPRYRLAPTSPGRYRIRREPNEHALSTLEATVSALAALEPDLAGLDRLTAAFDRMIEDQLNHKSTRWRRNQRRVKSKTNVPRVLMGNLGNIVVACGERQRGNKQDRGRARHHNAKPIYWAAQRLATGETFRCAIQSPSLHDAEFLKLLGLPSNVGDTAVSMEVFREQWKQFLQPNDRLTVYHPSTAKLIKNVDADFETSLVLKSVKAGRDWSDGGNIDARSDHSKNQSGQTSRAALRVQNAIQLIEYIRSLSNVELSQTTDSVISQ